MSLIARLIECGAPADVIEDVALLVAEKRALDERRAKDAARKREERAEQAVASADVQGHPGQDGTSQDDPSLSPSPKENNSKPHPHTHPENKTRARKGHRLSDDWEPKPLTGDIAKAVGLWPPGAIERELAKFRDWAASANGPNALKKDWDAAWRNWLRKADEDGRYGAKPSHQRGNSTRNAAQGALLRLAG